MTISADDEIFSRVYWDTDVEGAIWVRGRQYKAKFDHTGATYMPLFGSEQPQHYPLQMSLAGATGGGDTIPLIEVRSAVRDGERVVLKHGPIDEVYEVGVEGLEQTFVISERPAGDLRLFVSLQSEIACSKHDDGFEFANEFGAVRYSRAFVREGDGKKRALATRLVEGGIEIEIEHEYLATASFPLVVDPLVSTFDVDTSATYSHSNPDVSYDVTTNRYLYVYETLTLRTDRDVYSKLKNASGATVGAGWVDLTAQDWRDPSVGNLNYFDQFLVAASVGGLPGSTRRVICHRRTGAAGVSYTPTLPIQTGVVRDQVDPMVGSDPEMYPTGLPILDYAIVYEEIVSASDHRIRIAGVSHTGLADIPWYDLSSAFGGATLNTKPTISKGNSGQIWNVAWQRMVTPTNADIYSAQVDWALNVTTPAFPVATSAYNDTNPSVSGHLEDGSYMVVWERAFSTDHDIFAANVLDGVVTSISNLTLLENAGTLFQDQIEPAIDSNRDFFSIAYAENYGLSTTDYDIYAASFYSVSTSIGLAEPRMAFASVIGAQREPAIVALASSESHGWGHSTYGLAWTDGFSTGNMNIEGGSLDVVYPVPISAFCNGREIGALCPCLPGEEPWRGCPNSAFPGGALLSASGYARLGSDTLVLTVTDVTGPVVFNQFNSFAAYATPFFDGVLCVGGATRRLGVVSPTTSFASYPSYTAPTPISVVGGPILPNTTRLYQCWYRDPATYCTVRNDNLTNGLSLLWRP